MGEKEVSERFRVTRHVARVQFVAVDVVVEAEDFDGAKEKADKAVLATPFRSAVLDPAVYGINASILGEHVMDTVQPNDREEMGWLFNEYAPDHVIAACLAASRILDKTK